MNDDNFRKMLGEWLTEKRKEANLTQQQAADRMGCTNTRISNWEQGIRDMSAKELFRYCEAIHADPKEFTEMLRRLHK